MNEKYFTGIGSRETPDDICKMMTQIAIFLERKGWTLRSGGANGADLAFQRGVKNHSNIFLPWEKFNGQTTGTVIKDKTVISDAMYIIQQHHLHEQWKALINNPKQAKNLKFHIRNVFQVLGSDLKTPSKMLICWTPDAATGHNDSDFNTGGTRTAIRLADSFGIPVFNLKKPEHLMRLDNFIANEKKAQVKNKSRMSFNK